jgi:hypothetical protein
MSSKWHPSKGRGSHQGGHTFRSREDGEWGRGKLPFPLIKSVVGMNGGYYQSIGAPHGIFLFFHELLSKGGHPFSNEMVNVGCGLSKGGLSKLEIIFPT